MTDTEQPRPVWLDEIELGLSDDALAGLVRSRFKAAPADATEAVRETIAEWHRADTPEMRDVSQERAVLSVLGKPDNNYLPNPDDDPARPVR